MVLEGCGAVCDIIAAPVHLVGIFVELFSFFEHVSLLVLVLPPCSVEAAGRTAETALEGHPFPVLEDVWGTAVHDGPFLSPAVPDLASVDLLSN